MLIIINFEINLKTFFFSCKRKLKLKEIKNIETKKNKYLFNLEKKQKTIEIIIKKEEEDNKTNGALKLIYIISNRKL